MSSCNPCLRDQYTLLYEQLSIETDRRLAFQKERDEAQQRIKELEATIRIVAKITPLLCWLTEDCPEHNPDGCDCNAWAEFAAAVDRLGIEATPPNSEGTK